jgi:hypothetical protein
MCSISSMYLCSRSRSADVMTWLPTTRECRRGAFWA